MAIRTVTFTVNNDMSVSPSATQYGGVQGEHNATEVVFTYGADSPLTNPQLTMYIEVMTSVGGYDKTNTLTPENNTLHTLVPLAWTQYGAVTTLRLVSELGGAVAFTAEGKIRFDERQTAMEKVDSLLRNDISASMAVCHEAVKDCHTFVDDCREAVAACEEIAKLDSPTATAAANKAAIAANAAADNANNAADDAARVRQEVADGGFIESLRELNRGDKFHIWIGSKEEYNTLTDTPINTLCIFVDDDIADYVVEQGVSDGWTYRKWASGIAECWCGKPHTISWAGADPIYHSTTWLSVHFPVNLFTSIPVVTSDFRNDVGAIVISSTGQVLPETAAFLFSRVRGGNDDVVGWLHIQAKGNWK